MKLVTYSNNGREQLAFCINDNLYDTNTANPELPGMMGDLLNNWDAHIDLARRTEETTLDLVDDRDFEKSILSTGRRGGGLPSQLLELATNAQGE